MAINYDRNKKYFNVPSPKMGMILAGVGLLMLIAAPGAGKAIGFLLLGGGVALLYFQFAGKPTDQELDSDALSVISNVKQRALAAHGLDADQVSLIDPVVVHGYDFDSGVQVKRGKDGVYRTSRYEGVVLYFSEHQIYAYRFGMSLVSAGSTSEETDEYFYRDVVSFATQTRTSKFSYNGKSEESTYKEFKLTTTAGSSFTSSIRDEGSFDRVISGARSLLREKKTA